MRRCSCVAAPELMLSRRMCRYYSHLEWEEQARRDEEYLRNCAEYPIGESGACAPRQHERKFDACFLRKTA